MNKNKLIKTKYNDFLFYYFAILEKRVNKTNQKRQMMCFVINTTIKRVDYRLPVEIRTMRCKWLLIS